MEIDAPCFTYFSSPIEKYTLPKRFTFPFYYQPHPLCKLAVQQLQKHLETQIQWQHNFGLFDDTKNIIGKMFGVLLVKNAQGELGFISAFSGKLAEQNHINGFVPPVFDLLAADSFFLDEKVVINALNTEIEELEKTPQLLILGEELSTLKAKHTLQLLVLRAELIENRKTRKITRQTLQNDVNTTITNKGLKALAQQSVYDKWRLKALTQNSQQSIGLLQIKVDALTEQIAKCKLQRKILSADLQNRIFSQYQFLNKARAAKSLVDIFAETALKKPPAGAGECAAPKLLQYAFEHQLVPLAMAEFWWGASPKSEIKKHQQYYPACIGKCQPILKHMLAGMLLDDNPLICNNGEGKNVDIIYQDEDILIVNKPTELLSVPGKEINDSVYSRIKQHYPEATGPLIVHRLDMSTSGLMVLVLNAQANKHLQKQFIRREVHKQYVALIEGLPPENEGEINLPLRGDLYDRPKQIVCNQDGKQAKTFWQVLERYPQKNQTKVLLTPHTGRTHQLRVHCAHAQGLNMPIVGDDLYGTLANRLHLHAHSLKIRHPISKKIMTFKVAAEF
ncbi:MAG: tRNA pseudouridine32 synthase/23S rRNA pseudouridine746 synthase [Alphaproteobacteria bacterium]|jgi:tRNA pseudouridine32 synthase/23S rRNA pseudouridine746 synthase